MRWWQDELACSWDTCKPLLARAPGVASRWPPVAPGMPHREVVCYGDGSVAAICRAGASPRLELTASDIELWSPNWSKVRTVLTSALQLTTSTASPCPPNRLLRIGQWEPKSQTAFPVVLVAGSSVSRFTDLVKRAVSNATHPAIVLSMTRGSWTDELREWVAGKKAMLAALTDLIELGEEGVWVATPAWAETLEAFAPRAGFNPAAPTQNKRKPARNSQRLGDIDLLYKIVCKEAGRRVRLMKRNKDQGSETKLPRFTQTQLGEVSGLGQTRVWRALHDDRGAKLRDLFDRLGDTDALWRWRDESLLDAKLCSSPAMLQVNKQSVLISK